MIGTLLHISSNKVFYFDNEDIFHVIEGIEDMDSFLKDENLGGLAENKTSTNTSKKGNKYIQLRFILNATGIETMKRYLRRKTGICNININKVQRTSNLLKDGSTIQDFISIYDEIGRASVYEKLKKQNDCVYIISISAPTYLRRKGNKDVSTFDYISVNVLLKSSLTNEDKISYVKDNKKYICSEITSSVKKSYLYKSSHNGLDSDKFEIVKATLYPDSSVEVLLEKIQKEGR